MTFGRTTGNVCRYVGFQRIVGFHHHRDADVGPFTAGNRCQSSPFDLVDPGEVGESNRKCRSIRGRRLWRAWSTTLARGTKLYTQRRTYCRELHQRGLFGMGECPDSWLIQRSECHLAGEMQEGRNASTSHITILLLCEGFAAFCPESQETTNSQRLPSCWQPRRPLVPEIQAFGIRPCPP